MVLSFLGSQRSESGAVAASRPAGPTANASANVKGAYAVQIAATASAAAWVQVDLSRTASATDFLVDIAVGAAGVERVVIPDLPFSANTLTSFGHASYLIPLRIPAGSRIAARCQSAAGAGAVDAQVILFAPMFGGEQGLGAVEACGAVTATSLGTSVDPGGTTANTKGAWAPLIASTSFAYKWVCVSITHTNTLAAVGNAAFEIGIGASGQEVVLVPNICLAVGATADANPATGVCFPLAIPAGTRISARCEFSFTTALERLFEVVVHGAG